MTDMWAIDTLSDVLDLQDIDEDMLAAATTQFLDTMNKYEIK
jgi:hypothetical protein